MNYKIAGVDSIIIYFGDKIDKKISDKVLLSFKLIKNSDLKQIIEIVPSYSSIYIQFDIFKDSHDTLYEKIQYIMQNDSSDNIEKNTNIVTIPVYYGKEIGIDLKRVADFNNLNIEDVIAIHSTKIYDVYTIGFAPGFAYMGEADVRIRTPRLKTPRKKIKKGSVALADAQTAVYPLDSPGGWNILGVTYIDMFNKGIDGFSYLKIGDKVKFNPVTKDEYLKNGGLL